MTDIPADLGATGDRDDAASSPLPLAVCWLIWSAVSASLWWVVWSITTSFL